jgi:CheY-like chemotaxis protein
MFMVLVPTFVVMTAGISSNDGSNVHMDRIDPWFIISLIVSYLLSFITNALTYRDICQMFSNRARDSAYVRDDTMLEISHEFLQLSHIVDCALHLTIEPSALQRESDHIRCMMWLLKKQRLEVQSLRHVGLETLGSRNRRAPCDQSLWTLLKSEFKPAGELYGECFASICRMSRCHVEFTHHFHGSDDPFIVSEESDLRHFLCSFMFSVLMKFCKGRHDDSLKCCVKVSVCRRDTLCNLLTDRFHFSREFTGDRPLSLAVSGHQVHSALVAPEDTQYFQVVVDKCHSEPAFVSSTSDHLLWIASFSELENVAVLDYITRMNGYMTIPPHDSSSSVGCIGAFALPCKIGLLEEVLPRECSFVVTSPEQPLVASTVPLRILMVEDQPLIAKSFIKRLQESSLTAHYVVHHALNVAQALSSFRSCSQPLPGQTSGDGISAYDVVLLDNNMPLTDGALAVADAGVRLIDDLCAYARVPNARTWLFTPNAQVEAAFSLRALENDNKLPKAVMVPPLLFMLLWHRPSIKCCRLASQAVARTRRRNLLKNARAMYGVVSSVIRRVVRVSLRSCIIGPPTAFFR